MSANQTTKHAFRSPTKRTPSLALVLSSAVSCAVLFLGRRHLFDGSFQRRNLPVCVPFCADAVPSLQRADVARCTDTRLMFRLSRLPLPRRIGLLPVRAPFARLHTVAPRRVFVGSESKLYCKPHSQAPNPVSLPLPVPETKPIVSGVSLRRSSEVMYHSRPESVMHTAESLERSTVSRAASSARPPSHHQHIPRLRRSVWCAVPRGVAKARSWSSLERRMSARRGA